MRKDQYDNTIVFARKNIDYSQYRCHTLNYFLKENRQIYTANWRKMKKNTKT